MLDQTHHADDALAPDRRHRAGDLLAHQHVEMFAQLGQPLGAIVAVAVGRVNGIGNAAEQVHEEAHLGQRHGVGVIENALDGGGGGEERWHFFKLNIIV